MEELVKLLAEVQDKWGEETVKAIIKKLDSYPIKWQGTLRRSVSYSQKQSGDIEFLMADYGKFIDEGVDGTLIKRNSPYSFKGNIPGTAFYIKKWADSKGINPYAAATSIQRRGIEPRPFFNDVIESRIDDLGEAINKAQQEYIDKTINNISD